MVIALFGLLVVGLGLTVFLQRRPGNAMTLLVLALAVSFALPQRFEIQGLDTAGAPSVVVGAALLGLWALNRLRPQEPLDPRTDVAPVLAAITLGLWLLLSASQGLRPPPPGTTSDAFLREVLFFASQLGILLYASDAIRTQTDLHRLLRTMTLLSTAVAVLGLVQFVSGVDPLNTLNLPGLVPADTQNLERIRSGFLRVRGTAFHPIEFSVVLATMLPVAIGYALLSNRRERRRLYGVCAFVIGTAALLSISRSGVLAIAVAVTVTAIHLGWPQRIRLAIGGAVGVVLVYLTVPGLLGTLRGLVSNTGNDPSIQARVDDIPFVLDVLRRSPLLGGAAPDVQPDAILLDNEFFQRIVNGGLVSLVGLLVLVLVPLLLSWARTRLGDDEDAQMHAGMLTASLSAATVSLATFDGFFFRLYLTVLLVLIAAGCAAWRLRDEDPLARSAVPVRRRFTGASLPVSTPYASRGRSSRARTARATGRGSTPPSAEA